MLSSDKFFEKLPVLREFLQMTRPENYVPVPETWTVFISDVRNSTKAIEGGRYKDVNLIGASSIISVVNAVGSDKLLYVFGGDGATFVVAPDQVEQTRKALLATQALSQREFSLELRVAQIPVRDLYDRGHDFGAARWRLSDKVSQTLLTGSGVQAGDKLAKDKQQGSRYLLIPTDEEKTTAEQQGDFTGLECRWNPIQSRKGQMLTLLVECGSAAGYQKVISAIEEIYGGEDGLRPQSDENMRVGIFSLRNYLKESQIQARRFGRWFYAISAWAATVTAQILWDVLKLNPLRRYKDEVIEHSDYRKFDGMLRMVLDGSNVQHDALEFRLGQWHEQGELTYGVHRSDSALMTCLIFDRWAGNHLHFLDGNDGGYAMAARGLKSQLKAKAVTQEAFTFGQLSG